MAIRLGSMGDPLSVSLIIKGETGVLRGDLEVLDEDRRKAESSLRKRRFNNSISRLRLRSAHALFRKCELGTWNGQ